MKNVKAGSTTDGCVQCVKPNGVETWYRDDIQTGQDSNM